MNDSSELGINAFQVSRSTKRLTSTANEEKLQMSGHPEVPESRGQRRWSLT